MKNARAVTLLALFVGALSGSAQAATFQIGSFQSAAGNYNYSNGTGSLTGTTTGGFTFDPGAVALLGVPAGTFLGATLQVSTDDTSGITSTVVAGVGTVLTESHDGFLEVRSSANELILRAAFTDGVLIGLEGGTTARLIGESETAGTVIDFTSDFFTDTITTPYGFTFELTPLCAQAQTPCIATTSLNAGAGGNFNSFFAPDTANFAGSVDEIPEPASLTLFGLGLGAVSVLARRRRRS